jgi:hypothetical protein
MSCLVATTTTEGRAVATWATTQRWWLRPRTMAAVAAVCLAMSGCAHFHPVPLAGAPRDAQFIDVDGVHVR